MNFSLSSILKYVVEGIAVGVCTYLITGRRSNLSSIILLGISAGVTFMILDLFTSGIGLSARQGAGFGLGARTVGMGTGGISSLMQEGFDNGEPDHTNLDIPYYQGLTNDRVSGPAPIDYLNQVPYRFGNSDPVTCPQKPIPGNIQSAPYSKIKGQSRWMGWSETSRPINQNTQDYKLIPGLYSRYVLQSGYREGVAPANETAQQAQLAPTILPTLNPLDRGRFKKESNFENKETLDTAQTRIETFDGASTVRLSDVMYSGDIIDLMSGTDIMQREMVSSQILFNPLLPLVRTNLSKVRFTLSGAVHNPMLQNPIKYGQPVYLKHNALKNNENNVFYIKFGLKAQSHQSDDDIYSTFKIINIRDIMSQDYVRYGDEFFIAKGEITGDSDKTYLRVEADKSLSAEATISDATAFNAVLQRPYELLDRNLCICPKETIFP